MKRIALAVVVSTVGTVVPHTRLLAQPSCQDASLQAYWDSGTSCRLSDVSLTFLHRSDAYVDGITAGREPVRIQPLLSGLPANTFGVRISRFGGDFVATASGIQDHWLTSGFELNAYVEPIVGGRAIRGAYLTNLVGSFAGLPQPGEFGPPGHGFGVLSARLLHETTDGWDYDRISWYRGYGWNQSDEHTCEKNGVYSRVCIDTLVEFSGPTQLVIVADGLVGWGDARGASDGAIQARLTSVDVLFQYGPTTVTPEPGTFGLTLTACIGALAVGVRRRRARSPRV